MSHSSISSRHASQHSLPRSIWWLSVVSFFEKSATTMVLGLLPLFMVSVLGISVGTVGFINGLVEALSLMLRVVSGAVTDYVGRRKTMLMLGYSLAALTKPIIAMSSGLAGVLATRVGDRISNGLQAPPRDALVSDLTPKALKGRAYGLRQTLGAAGCFAGSILATTLMVLLHGNYRLIFWLSMIPAVLAVIVLWAGVKEPEAPAEEPMVGRSHIKVRLSFRDLKELPASYWLLIVISGIFMCARFSESLVVLYGSHEGVPDSHTPFILAVINLTCAFSAYPIGRLSDYVSRRMLAVLGFLTLVASDLFLFGATGLVMTFVGVILWGVQQGITQSILPAMIADRTPANLRGTAFGLYYCTHGVSVLIAGTLAGQLWEGFGPRTAFLSGALLAGFAALLMMLLPLGSVPREKPDVL